MPLDLSPAPAPQSDLSARLTALIDAAMVAKQRADYAAGRGSGAGDVAKKRIGAGYIATPCDRALAYRYHRAEKEKRDSPVSPGALQRHAEAGHWTEASMADWLRLIGCDLRTTTGRMIPQPDGTEKPEQFGYKVARDENGQARIAGEIDGVIVAVPPGIGLPVPCLWESKKATAKKWAKFAKSGVRAADDAYYGQLQTNMAYLEVHATLFTMLNLDSMAIYAELVAFDVATAQHLTDRAVKVLGTREPEEMPRISRDPADHRCRFCDYHGRCWRPEPVKPSLPPPAWARR